ncbi:TPA: hypothetical protein ACSTJZ_003146 [Serratia fonticola]
MKEREYFVISVRHTNRHNPYVTLWAANDAGYRGRLETAGRYTESQIRKCLHYYNNGCDTVAVPCDVAQSLSFSIQPGFFDDDNGSWLPNNRATWKELLANVIEKPKHPPCPEYRGAPRHSEAHHEE